MKNDLYVIDEKTYMQHIDDEVHLYGLLRQLAFLAGKIKEAVDVTHLLDTAKRYGEIAEETFEAWSIPGRYCVFGDKADLSGLMEKELCALEVYQEDDEAEDDCEDGEPSYFEVMDHLIAKSKAVTADMEAVLAELDTAFSSFRHDDDE